MAVLVIAITFIYRADATDAGPAPVVIVMGDSISAGCCASEEDTWPAASLLQLRPGAHRSLTLA